MRKFEECFEMERLSGVSERAPGHPPPRIPPYYPSPSSPTFTNQPHLQLAIRARRKAGKNTSHQFAPSLSQLPANPHKAIGKLPLDPF